MVLQPDTILLGKYEILSAIGEGGYGQVYLARDLAMDRQVAIKELPRHLAEEDDARWQRFGARFRREAQTVGQFEHPNVVGAYALDSDAEGNLYLVLEYVDGGSLEALLAAGAPLPVERALDIAIDVCRAIEAMYRRDIVHRDIKPSNILLTSAPTPGGPVAKLTDFGIAQVGHETRRTQETLAHPGTPAFMSPEQATSTGYLDQRSDLYSLGLVLYEMLTGETYLRNQVSPRSRNLLVPASLDAVVMRALRNDPIDRYQDAGEMLADLLSVRDQRLLGQARIMLRTIKAQQIATSLIVLVVVLLLYGGLTLGRAIRQVLASPTALATLVPAPLETPTWDPGWPTATQTPTAPVPTGTPTLSPADPYEPDDVVAAPISIGEVQTRAFDPQDDVDRVAFRVKAGRMYLVTTSNLAVGVDTLLEVQVDGQLLTNDDQSPGTLASQVLFTAAADGMVIATVYNQDLYGPERTYDLSVVVVEPTLTPMATQTPVASEATLTAQPSLAAQTVTPTPTWTLRPSLTVTPSSTRTLTTTRTVTPTRTPTRTRTVTPTRTVTTTRTLSLSPTVTQIPSPTSTPTPARTLPPVRTPYPGS